MLSVNTNISALMAAAAGTLTSRGEAAVMEQLSTGKRINQAADDVAGLAISTRLMSQIKGTNQAIRNTNDGISLLQTADGALGGITNALQRMRELCVQSLNDTNNSADRSFIENELSSLQQEIGRIVKTTQFNNMTLLDGSSGTQQSDGSSRFNISTTPNGDPTQFSMPNLSTFTLPPAPPITPASSGTLGPGRNNANPSISVTGSAPAGTNFSANGRLYLQYAYSGSTPVIYQAYFVTGADATAPDWTNWTSGVNITNAVSVTGNSSSSVITINAGTGVSDRPITINVAGFIPPWNGVSIDVTGVSANTTPTLSTDHTVNVNTTTQAIASGDFDHNGTTDLAVIDQANSTLTIMSGEGNGSFHQTHIYNTGGLNPSSVVTGDFNGDGKLDIAVLNEGDATLSIFSGNGDGSFTQTQNYQTFHTGGKLLVGDFNGDGKLDLIHSIPAEPYTGIMLGNGDGTFQPDHGGAGLYYQTDIATADVNNNGTTDYAILKNDVEMTLTNPDGSFVYNMIPDTQGYSPDKIAFGDLNNDGKADMILASSVTGKVITRLGNGDGTFQDPTAYSVGVGGGGITVGDFNGDGNLDVAVASPSGLGVSLLLGNGDGTLNFPNGYALTSGGNVSGMTVADFNNDGKPDIATSNIGANALNVFLNQTPTPPTPPSPTSTLTLDNIDSFLATISGIRANIGASISQLGFSIDNLTIESTHAQESLSRIQDTDYSAATTELAKQEIIQKASTAMMAQANQQPQVVLQLLKSTTS